MTKITMAALPIVDATEAGSMYPHQKRMYMRDWGMCDLHMEMIFPLTLSP